jgi:hypothetical protein
MNTDEAGDRQSAGEQTAVLPETASQLVELERLQLALGEAEERAKNHWGQYLRAVADLDNVRKRAQKDIEATNRYGLAAAPSQGTGKDRHRDHQSGRRAFRSGAPRGDAGTAVEYGRAELGAAGGAAGL